MLKYTSDTKESIQLIKSNINDLVGHIIVNKLDSELFILHSFSHGLNKFENIDSATDFICVLAEKHTQHESDVILVIDHTNLLGKYL